MIQIFEERSDAFLQRPKPRAHQPNYATGKNHPLNLTQLLIIVLAVQREPFPSHLLKALGLVFSLLLRD